MTQTLFIVSKWFVFIIFTTNNKHKKNNKCKLSKNLHYIYRYHNNNIDFYVHTIFRVRGKWAKSSSKNERKKNRKKGRKIKKVVIFSCIFLLWEKMTTSCVTTMRTCSRLKTDWVVILENWSGVFVVSRGRQNRSHSRDNLYGRQKAANHKQYIA